MEKYKYLCGLEKWPAENLLFNSENQLFNKEKWQT